MTERERSDTGSVMKIRSKLVLLYLVCGIVYVEGMLLSR